MPEYDDFTKPITFDIELNDQQFISTLTGGTSWVWEVTDFYAKFFDKLDANMFSDNPTSFSFGGKFITDRFKEGN